MSTSAIRLAGSSARSILPDTRAGNHCPDGGRLSRDRFFDHCREFLTNREDQLYAAAEIQRRRWWIPKAVNRQIAKAIIGGVKEIIPNLREPGGVARQNLLRGIEHFAQELSASPEYRARVVSSGSAAAFRALAISAVSRLTSDNITAASTAS